MSAQIGSKLAPRRPGVRNRTSGPSGPLIIDPNKLGQIALNRDAIQALTFAQAKVQITISAGGTTAILVSEDTGRQIGGVDDLAKLLSLRSYVTKEKKQTASSEAREQAVLAAYRVSSRLKETDKNFEQGVLDGSYIVAVKPYMTMCQNVKAHMMSIKENFNTPDDWKEILSNLCQNTMNVLVEVISRITKGEKEKGLLDQISFDRGLPAYVRNKLTTKSLAVQKDMDLTRILFPSDPSKGLSLTVKEWRSTEFIKSLGKLLINSEIIAMITRVDELFLELIGMTAEQFANKEDPRVQRVEKTRILVVPPFEDYKRVLSLLEKTNFRGFGLPATAMDQSKDRLANLCAVPIRAYAFSVRMAETIPDFYDRIFPPGTIKKPDEKLGNYAKQCLAALESGVECKLTDILQGAASPKAFMAWASRECKIIPDGSLYKLIEKSLGIQNGSEVFCANSGTDPDAPPKQPGGALADVTSGPIGAGELAAKDEFEEKFFAKTAKDRKKRQGVAASVLQENGKAFLRKVRREHSRALAESMESYFRGFYAEQVQAAAIQIAIARFDEIDDEVADKTDTESDYSDDSE